MFISELQKEKEREKILSEFMQTTIPWILEMFFIESCKISGEKAMETSEVYNSGILHFT